MKSKKEIKRERLKNEEEERSLVFSIEKGDCAGYGPQGRPEIIYER